MFPKLFCLQTRYVGYTDFGTFEFANSIGSFSCRCSWSSQGDRTILTILLPGPGVEVLRPVWQGWSQAYRLVSPRCTAWQPAPPRRRVHTARPRSAPLGYTPLVRSLGGGRRADDVRQEL